MLELWNYNWLYQNYQTHSTQFHLSKELDLPEQIKFQSKYMQVLGKQSIPKLIHTPLKALDRSNTN